MAEPTLYRRFVRQPLEEALEDTPVVLIHGPRQCGKTTLARMVGDAAGYEYITFDCPSFPGILEIFLNPVSWSAVQLLHFLQQLQLMEKPTMVDSCARSSRSRRISS